MQALNEQDWERGHRMDTNLQSHKQEGVLNSTSRNGLATLPGMSQRVMSYERNWDEVNNSDGKEGNQ